MWSMTLTYLCALLGAIGVDAQYGDWHGDSMSGGGTYTNPILNKTGADPWVIQRNGYYYMTYTTNDNITLLRSPVLTDWNNAERKLLFEPPVGQNYSKSLWAPEL